MIGIVLLAVLIALGVASSMGWTADSRDPRYGVGLLLRRTWPNLSEQVGADAGCDRTG